jgi:hypothetical protein
MTTGIFLMLAPIMRYVNQRYQKRLFHAFMLQFGHDLMLGSGRLAGRFAVGFALGIFVIGLAGPEGFHGLAERRARLRQPARAENYQDDNQNEDNIHRSEIKRHD